MYDAASPKPVPCDNLEGGWGERQERGSRGRGHTYTMADSRRCMAKTLTIFRVSILQLKI